MDTEEDGQVRKVGEAKQMLYFTANAVRMGVARAGHATRAVYVIESSFPLLNNLRLPSKLRHGNRRP